MTEEEEEWVQTAMSDDSVVVDMLLRLRQAEPRTSSAPPSNQLQWRVRQRRSKQVSRKKNGDSTRASPTTPLSWSGGSGGVADVSFDESGTPYYKPIAIARSKVVATGEATTSKRSRKKKSLAELKEEESLLLKERRNLKNKLATLHLSFEKQRAENESLKRVKLEALSQQITETVRASASQEDILNQPYQLTGHCDSSCMILPENDDCINEVKPYPSHCSSEVHEGGSNRSSFMLPDLNLPFDDMIQHPRIYME